MKVPVPCSVGSERLDGHAGYLGQHCHGLVANLAVEPCNSLLGDSVIRITLYCAATLYETNLLYAERMPWPPAQENCS